MRSGRVIQVWLMCVLLGGIALAVPRAASSQAEDAAPVVSSVMEPMPVDQLIVKYRDEGKNEAFAPLSEQLERLSAHIGLAVEYVRPMGGGAHVLRLPSSLPVEEAERIAAHLSALPEIEYAEPDYVLHPALVPNDPNYGDQWHYFEPHGINLPQAWDVTIGITSVVVAVIDTGHRPHPDLASRIVGGYDFISIPSRAGDGDGRDSDPTDPGDWVSAGECYAGSPARNSSWHGTHVAGTIGAVTNNGTGVAGVTWRGRLLSVRVLGKCGGSLADIVDGIYWSAGLSVPGVPMNTNPARVLNLSLGGPSPSCSTSLQAAISAVNAVGAVVVVAAGNSNQPASDFQPANCAGVITVGATNRDGVRAWYSNYGAAVDISSPGGDSLGAVLSTGNAGSTAPGADNYQGKIGTSMAAPHVAGTVALMLSVKPSLNYALAEQLLRATAKPFGSGHSCTGSTTCGAGIVNAHAAVLAAQRFAPRGFLPVVRR
ncbi:MAG: S8 family serine peptidase [Anaerolineae bacterium]|nr:S8 family serine peptidase [Anaerolineae bacterium]